MSQPEVRRFQFRLWKLMVAVVLAALATAAVEHGFRIAREKELRQLELAKQIALLQRDLSNQTMKMRLTAGAIRAEEWRGNPNRPRGVRGGSLSLIELEKELAEFRRRQEDLNKEIETLEVRFQWCAP